MKIAIVSTRETKEVSDLLGKALALGVDCFHVNAADPNTEGIDADIIYWRSSPVTKTFKKTVGRSVVIKRLQRTARVVNEVLTENPLITNKSYQQAHAAAVLPHIAGITSYLAYDEHALRELIDSKKLVYPFIAKPDCGSQGNGVVLVESQSDLKNIEGVRNCIFQNYIPNDGDYRVFVVGGVAVDVVHRRPTEKSTKHYLNNISQGGIAEPVLDTKLYFTLAKKAEAVATAFGLTICGVDLIQNKETGTIHFMEVNSAVQWVIFERALKTDVGKAVLQTLCELSTRQMPLPIKHAREFYEQRLQFLHPAKQFHFLSRLYLTTKDDRYKVKLDALRNAWLPDIKPLVKVAKELPDLSLPKRKGGRAYRKESYRKHYKIYKYNLIFFKALFLETVYNESDTSRTLIEAIDAQDAEQTFQKLIADKEAIFRLSTHAVNFLYHYAHFFGVQIDPKMILKIGMEHQMRDPTFDLEAHCYLYTHAIIGASRFYRDLQIHTDLHIYTEMVRKTEAYIRENFTKVSLDIKCEFLVCAGLVSYTPTLSGAIRSETEHSYSPHGNYVVDSFNNGSNKAFKKGVHNSEHRNVLAIMALDN